MTIRALWPIRRETPVTRLATQEMVTLIGVAAASPERTRRVVGVEATGINACPCAQGLVRGRASERLLEAGFGEDDVERILEPVPLATHNQRGRGTLLVGTESPVGRSRSRRHRGTLDERPRVRAAQAPRRAVRRRARASQAALRRGFGPQCPPGDALRVPQARRRRLRLLAPGQSRDDPRPRRARRAGGDGRRVACRGRIRCRGRNADGGSPNGYGPRPHRRRSSASRSEAERISARRGT